MAVQPHTTRKIIKKSGTEKNLFFLETIASLGLTEEHDQKNLIGIRRNKNENGRHSDVVEYVPFFQSDPKGWRVPIVDINRNQFTARAEGSRMANPQWEVRLREPILKADGSHIKYIRPRGVSAQPVFCEPILIAFHNKQKIHTLIITEGTKKAFVGCMHGAYVVAVPGIHSLRNKNIGTIHPDILSLIIVCEVKRVVFLLDGDAAYLSAKAIESGDDLAARPKSFFTAVDTFRNLLVDHGLDLWVFVVNSDELASSARKSVEEVKGLDDLLHSFPDNRGDIITDLQTVLPSQFFVKVEVTHNLNKFSQYLGLPDVNSFIAPRLEKYPRLSEKEFKFGGGVYRWDSAESKCVEVAPAAAELFIRVRDDFFMRTGRPNKYGIQEETFVSIKKSTIIEVYGRKVLKHIKYYVGWTVVPSHTHYQEEVFNHRNLYLPLPHSPLNEEASPLDFPTITKYLEHLAGGRTASYTEGTTTFECTVYEMILDYLQILYLYPERQLPVLCLVSFENNTGKSTFPFYLRAELGGNVAIVGNDDIAGSFNSHWASKLVVVYDEAFIDKKIVFERIKSLSTAHKIFLNAKGRDQVELDFFAKFILITNHEEDFIRAGKEDIRFWILKVPVLAEVDVDILPKMEAEIPAFLAFLRDRKLVTERKNRMHFHPGLLRTEALSRVVEYSQPAVEKDIRHYLKEMFLDTGLQVIEMTQKAIHMEALGGKQNANYVEKILKKNMGLLPYHVWVFDSHEYPSKEEAFFFARQKNPEKSDVEIDNLITIKFKTKRYSYYKYIVDHSTGSPVMKRIQVDDVGRPYVFHRKDFVPENEEVEASGEDSVTTDALDDDELPFPASRK